MGVVVRSGGELDNHSELASVLLVDDDGDFRETMSLWLADDDRVDVHEAANGEQALRKLDSDIDVLVIDREMPLLSGSDVIKQLSETTFRGVVIVISAYQEDIYLNSKDVAAYLTKPITYDEFAAELDRHLL